MIHYINFFFNNIEYDENYYQAEFSSPDVNVHCNFRYNRKTKCCEEIWNYNRPPEEIETDSSLVVGEKNAGKWKVTLL